MKCGLGLAGPTFLESTAGRLEMVLCCEIWEALERSSNLSRNISKAKWLSQKLRRSERWKERKKERNLGKGEVFMVGIGTLVNAPIPKRSIHVTPLRQYQ